MVEVNYNCVEEFPDAAKLIINVVKEVLKYEGVLREVDVYITLTNDEEIHKINKQYRNVDNPTDVLSFPMFEPDEIPALKESTEAIEEILGDIIISVPKVSKQAIEYGHSFERELAYLTAHGMFHLLGYDHMKDDEKAIMRAKEEAVMELLNIKR